MSNCQITFVIIFASVIFVCTIVGIFQKKSLDDLYEDCLNKFIFKYKDDSEEDIIELYYDARRKEYKIEENYDRLNSYSEREYVEISALVDGLEQIALSKGYTLPTEDEILVYSNKG